MFCSNCGSQTDGKFCSKCGNETSGGSTNDQTAKKSRSRTAILASAIGGGVLLTVVLGLIFTGFFGISNVESSADPDDEIRNSAEYGVVDLFFTRMVANEGIREGLCASEDVFRSVASTYYTDEGFTYEELKLLYPAIALVYEDRC